MNHSTQTLLEYSFAAYRVNKYVYVKHTQEHNQVYSNRDLIFRTLKSEYWPPNGESGGFQKLVVTDDDRKALDQARQYMRRYTMLSLGNLTQFQTDVYSAYLAEETSEKHIGLIAYFPIFVDREMREKVFKQTLKQEYSNSQHFFDKNIMEQVEILKVIPLADYAKNLYIAGTNGNLVTFCVTEQYSVGSSLYISARVKKQDKEHSTGYATTQLNYVKVLEER